MPFDEDVNHSHLRCYGSKTVLHQQWESRGHDEFTQGGSMIASGGAAESAQSAGGAWKRWRTRQSIEQVLEQAGEVDQKAEHTLQASLLDVKQAPPVTSPAWAASGEKRDSLLMNNKHTLKS